ncbi:hypothetical protein ALC53_06773 [Atta colombica]|uniref:Uncharacterized protein n=1 Tax=Atta colombica TaxID=520822 RepID=A0A151I3S3_9HYME|nr:hypothetical protein ALC53_06773 [Atta colombica]
MESIQLYLIILKTHETVNEIALIPVKLLNTEEVQVVVLGARLHAAFRIISQIDTSAFGFGSHRSTATRHRVGRHRPNG